jgi:hypothetical protein
MISKNLDLSGTSAADMMTVKVVFAFLGSVPELTVTPTWIAIRHQAVGYACEQHRFIATELNARQYLLERLRQIARDRWPGGRAGWKGHGSLGNLRGNALELNAYRSELTKIGLHYSGEWITEGIYPIDATQANLDALCEEKLSLWELGLGGTDSAAIRAAVLVLAPNSD